MDFDLTFDLILEFYLALNFDLTLDFDLNFAKYGCKKFFASELGSKSGVMRGFQKGITFVGRTSKSVNFMGLQNMVAKKFAKFLHLSWDLSWGL